MGVEHKHARHIRIRPRAESWSHLREPLPLRQRPLHDAAVVVRSVQDGRLMLRGVGGRAGLPEYERKHSCRTGDCTFCLYELSINHLQ